MEQSESIHRFEEPELEKVSTNEIVENIKRFLKDYKFITGEVEIADVSDVSPLNPALSVPHRLQNLLHLLEEEKQPLPSAAVEEPVSAEPLVEDLPDEQVVGVEEHKPLVE